MSAANDVYAGLIGQPSVKRFLTTAAADDGVSHAYLFLGRPGSGKTIAAYGLAASILCENGGCGTCDTCIRVLRRTHPDLHHLMPEGVAGYVVSQIRELVHDANLSPIRASSKVYLIDRAELLQGAPANALLKTLEEPPAGVVFILLARTREAMLPTISSRCTCVPFRTVPATEAAAILTSETGASNDEALRALSSSAWSLVRARDFLLSPSRRAVRSETMDVLDGLADDDDMDVLEAARTLLDVLKQPLAEVKAAQEAALAADSDYLARSALRTLEERQKRELGARERQGMTEFLAMVESWLRDCLLICEGKGDQVLNTDRYDSLLRVSGRLDSTGAISALHAVGDASTSITYNVSPQLVIENLLFDIRKVMR